MAHSFHDRHTALVIARTVKWAGVAILSFLLAAFAAGYWLLHSAPGSRWLWNRVTAAVPGDLGAATADGSLADGFRLTDVSYDSTSLRIAVSKVQLALDLDVLPLAVNLSAVHVDNAVVQQFEQPATEEPPAGFRLESLVLPVPIGIDKLTVRNLTVLNGNGDRLIAVDNAELAGAWHDEISLSRTQIDSSVASIDGAISLGLIAPYNASASVAVVYSLELDAKTQMPVHVAAKAEGDLQKLQIDMTSDDPHLHVTGTLSQLTDDPGWDVKVQSRYLQWPLDGQSPQVYVRDATLRSIGHLTDYSVSGDGAVAVAGTDELQFSLDADGDRNGLEVAGLELHGGMLDAESSGELRWEDGIAIAVNADVGRFDPAVLIAGWPAGSPVIGTVQAAWSRDKVQLTDVTLSVPDTGRTVDATGLFDLDRGVVDVDLDWQNLQWPIDAQNADYRSDFGRINVSGKPESWMLDGRIAFATAELPQGVFQLTGTGSREDVAVTLQESQVLGGSVAGFVTYRWHERVQWSAQLSAENIDIGTLVPGWPGRISTGFSASGRQEPLGVDIAIDRLDGVIRGRPVEADGGIQYTNGNLSVEQLRIVSGNSLLRANGSLQSDGGLDFSLEIDSLADFYPAAAGSLEADGNVSLAGEFPALRMNMQGQDLAWRDYRVRELTLVGKEAQSGAGIELDGNGQELTIGERQIEEFSIELAAGETRQQLGVEASMDDKLVEILLDGKFEDWRNPLESPWSGKLQSLNFEAPENIGLVLEKPADLRLDADLVSLHGACAIGAGEMRVCLDANWAQSGEFGLSAQLGAVPVDLVRLLFETDLEFSQTLDGSLSVSNAADRDLSAHALIDISPGQIRNQSDSGMAMRTHAGVFRFDLDDGQLLSGQLTLPFSSAAEIDARFDVVDIAMGANSGINGELKVKLDDIGVVSSIAPVIDTASGRLDVDIALAGTLASPDFTGAASLKNGNLSYEPLGLNLTDIQLQGRIQEDNYVELQSTFKAGDGSGELVSRADSLGGLSDGVELSLTGENLTIVDLPDINVVADMDLGLELYRDKLEIDGDILIPRARLSPVNITSTRVSESDDVVIVASANAEDEQVNDKESPFAIAGQVDLSLGKDVIIELDATEARVSGSTAFTWNGPPMPTANGEYKVAGRFEAYGQLLEITEGSVRFPDVPANNPVLRIRAEREIFGNPRIRNAGVLISGTAKNPEIEVYTNPATNRERALTLLVTGSDFNYEQGVGAVDVGTYIAPDLYISYGIGLFERENVISVRYDLTRGFGIKATSGKRAEGVDLSYTIER